MLRNSSSPQQVVSEEKP